MRVVSILILVLASGVSFASDQSPYSGEELRSIKSLSPQEVESLKSGKGMGFAKAAELNHYPGPKHVLELAEDLSLTSFQVAETTALFEEMQARAVKLGEELLNAELALDQDFENATVSPESLERALLEIGQIRARLRYVHLEAHLRQKRLLSAEQIMKYDESRGYRGSRHDHGKHHATSGKKH